MMTATVSLLTVTLAVSSAPVDYGREVKPLLTARCYACHGAVRQKGDLRLDTVAAMQKGGANGAAIVPGKGKESLLIQRVLGEGKKQRMPPAAEGELLDEAQIQLLQRWIDEGAKGPTDEKPDPDPRDHWAFRAPVRPAVPKVKNGDWNRNPIDAFLAVEHERLGLKPQSAVEKRLLLRRVYLDLIGLPPTREQSDAFVNDTAPDAYAKVVEKLLASPQYGERWGRHWMDVWRYSDWWGLGAEVRNSQKNIWQWRDWIVESLNEDKGYNQTIVEMLAADELTPTDDKSLRATGFLVRQYFKFNRTTWLDETIEHTSKAFLGLTFNCAKCHDHKYDPISQADYYRLRAVFEPYQVRHDVVSGESDLEKRSLPRVFDCNLDAPTYLHVRGDERNPKKDRVIAPGVPEFLSATPLDIKPVQLPFEVYQPGLRSFVLENHLRDAETLLVTARKQLADAKTMSGDSAAAMVTLAEKKLAVAGLMPLLWKARAAADQAAVKDAKAEATKLLRQTAAQLELQVKQAQAEVALAQASLEVLQAAPDKKKAAEQKQQTVKTALDKVKTEKVGDTYTPLLGALKTLENNIETEQSRRKPFPTTSTGRRSALAKWIADAKNPLTVRVAVNHIWMRHFGQPLVPTVFDFGRKGTMPTHPALLDWLAVELVENKWSMKHLHRLMVTSQAYRLTTSSAGAAEANRTVDGDNRYYWKRTPVRMESQMLRDSLLALSGELDLTRGGPAVESAAQEASKRRGLYFFHSANEKDRLLNTFDEADPLECYRRRESIVPQQALALTNGKFAQTQSDAIARRLTQELKNPDDTVFVKQAFVLMLGYEPNADEQKAAEEALAKLVGLFKSRNVADPGSRARGQLVNVLMNHNDFITIR